MVYLEPHRLGWEPLLASWLAKMHSIIGKDLCQLLDRLFKWQLPAALRFVRREVKEQSPTEDSALATSTMRLIEGLLYELRPVGQSTSGATGAVSDTNHSLPIDAATKIKRVEAAFLFSVVWAVGATGGTEDRDKFNTFFRTLTSGETPEVFPSCTL
jgi:dynein heavy chain, axonemal